MVRPDSNPALESSAGNPVRIDLGVGEELLLALKPHWIFVLIDRPLVLAISIALAGLGTQVLSGGAQLSALLAPGVWLSWQFIERGSRTYVLTDRRVVMVAGVLRQAVVDAPLSSVRQVSVFRSLPERILGLGTVTFATAGTAGQDLIWRVLERPLEAQRVARDTLDQRDAVS